MNLNTTDNTLISENMMNSSLMNIFSQLTNEQADLVRNKLIDELLKKENFKIENPMIQLLLTNKTNEYKIMQDLMKSKLLILPDNHPAKKILSQF
jgi:hypothetical protein